MREEITNKNKDCVFHSAYAGRDMYITMSQEPEREFVVTHNTNIKPVSYFTGRETELQDLRQRIEDGRKSVLVSGMGGIGKTHICRKLFEEYLNRHAKDENGPFRHMGYIEYSGDMDNSLQNGLKFKKQDSPEQNKEAAWRELEYLASGGKLLLFVDNVDRQISADPGLERLKGIPGAVILTSRLASFGDEFEPYRIGFLDMEQCKEIYGRIRFRSSGGEVKPEEIPDLEYVIGHLAGRHTITVEFLAHLAYIKSWTVKKLREELEQKGFRLAFHKDGGLVDIQESYEALYDLSGLTEAEQNILEAFSVFPYIPLAAGTCNEWLLADAGVSENDDILMGLYQKGWLQFDMGQGSYAMHPVFAQFIYEKYRPVLERHQGLVEGCRNSLEVPEGASILEYREYIPFAEKILEKIDMGEGEEQIGFISSLGYLLFKVAEYEKAEKLYRKSSKLCETILGELHPATATSYNNLAEMYKVQGECRKAEELHKKALRISESVMGEEHLDTVISYNNLAMLYGEQGEYRKAEELYEKSLRISEKVLGEEHPATAAGYNNLAGVYAEQGEYGKAEELYEKSLRIREKVLGEEHPDTATSYNNLAEVYAERREYGKAEELYEKSLRIREKVLGEEHPATAISYNNLAGVYADQEKYETAMIYYFKAYKICLIKLGISHPHTQIIYENMRGTYLKKNPEGNFDQWLEEKMKE